MTKIRNESTLASLSFADISAGICTIDLFEHFEEQSLLGLGQNDRIARVLKVYAGVKPLLKSLMLLPLIPSSWRIGIMLFIDTLDALASGDGDGTVPEKPVAQFKAGKDQAGRKRTAKKAGLTFRPIRKVARDARTGGFITRTEARRRPASTVVEQIKYPPRPASRKR